MDRKLERQPTALADAFLAGRMTRRTFVTRLLVLGLGSGAIGAILDAGRVAT